jgi:uncharacterized protein YqgC (DUF456 family)
VCIALGAIYFSSGRAAKLDIYVRLRLSTPAVSRALTLLGIILSGYVTGVLWPVNSVLFNFSVGFIGTLFTILISASLVWAACALYILVCHPLIKLFTLQKQKTFVELNATHDVVAPIIAARLAGTERTKGQWVGIAALIGVAVSWSLLVRWAILTAPNSFIMYSGWGAAGCAAASFGLYVIAGAYDNDDVGTFGLVVVIAGALFTTLMIAGLFVSV